MPHYDFGLHSFVNPYHFVRLDPAGCIRGEQETSQRLSGWIECELTTLSPLFIPNSSNDDLLGERDTTHPDKPEKIKSYDFFSYLDLSAHHPEQGRPAPPCPVIPGSELRGTIRSAFEAVTRSCMSSVDDDTVLYKRTSVAAKLGLLSKVGTHWQIQPCNRYGVAMQSTTVDPHDFSAVMVNLTDGDKVWIKQGDWYTKTIHDHPVNLFRVVSDIVPGTQPMPPGYVQGVFHKGESPTTGHKHHESVFVPDTTRPVVSATSEDVTRLEFNVKQYGVLAGASRYAGYPDLSAATRDIPVYYSDDCGALYLSPAAIGREVFQNRMRDLLSPGGYRPCDDPGSLCPACRLFGMVGDHGAVAGRVRFSDGVLANGTPNLGTLYDGWACLPELASPKPSATEFYLKRPSPGTHLWNYDYAANWRINPNGRYSGPLTAVPPTDYTPSIRGRKYYWHRHINTPPVQAAVCTKRNVDVRCLRPGVTFTFKVFFDGISQQELDRLLWVLSVGKRTVGGASTHALKMGMGKPVGLGSVRIIPTAVVQREFTIDGQSGCVSYELRTNIVPLDSYQWGTSNSEQMLLGCSPVVLNDFLTITSWAHAPSDVDYPRIENPGKNESYLWFMGNKTIRPASPMNPAIKQELPDITHPQLRKYREI